MNLEIIKLKKPSILKYLTAFILTLILGIIIFSESKVLLRFFLGRGIGADLLLLSFYLTTLLTPIYILIYLTQFYYYQNIGLRIWRKLISAAVISSVAIVLLAFGFRQLGPECIGGHGVGCAFSFLPFTLGVQSLLYFVATALILAFITTIINKYQTINDFFKNKSNKAYYLFLLIIVIANIFFLYPVYALYHKSFEEPCVLEFDFLDCQRKNALSKNDPSVCKQINDEVSCVSAFAYKNSDPKLCEILGEGYPDLWHRSQCYYSVAKLTKNQELCKNINEKATIYFPDNNLRDKCYLEIAQDTNNAGPCKNIVNIDIKKLCFETLPPVNRW